MNTQIFRTLLQTIDSHRCNRFWSFVICHFGIKIGVQIEYARCTRGLRSRSAGIKFIQGQRAQKVPSPTGLKRKYHYSGQISPSGLHYLIRNCTFEPSSDQSIDWVDSCMRDIDNAFRFRNAAIIESHRVNYVGTLDSRNRDNNLKQLKALFTQILKKWPNVRFISTSEYGEKMLANE